MNDETRTPNPLLSRLGSALESAINRAVALDAATREKIAKLDGRRIGVELKPLDLALAITVDRDRLRVGPHWERERDLNLRASPASLLAFAMRRGDDSVLPPGKVDISGDAELARQFEKIMRDFHPDFEEAFAQTFGDVLGVPIARVVRSAFAWTRESAKSARARCGGIRARRKPRCRRRRRSRAVLRRRRCICANAPTGLMRASGVSEKRR